ncbi:hypothetical protein L1987_74868 [Smallanthus sonchifolius]|uniref:Uncharacterized protein n=1 Tax=Smallanthus sonchifolius TaxID=185202 RepID=A0ACB9A3E3_9ASTR|nr:hypothetical protein L1987_74868 [Smallanthus sonchifolius]
MQYTRRSGACRKRKLYLHQMQPLAHLTDRHPPISPTLSSLHIKPPLTLSLNTFIPLSQYFFINPHQK